MYGPYGNESSLSSRKSINSREMNYSELLRARPRRIAHLLPLLLRHRCIVLQERNDIVAHDRWVGVTSAMSKSRQPGRWSITHNGSSVFVSHDLNAGWSCASGNSMMYALLLCVLGVEVTKRSGMRRTRGSRHEKASHQHHTSRRVYFTSSLRACGTRHSQHGDRRWSVFPCRPFL